MVGDVTLAQKLQEELKYEQDAAEISQTTPEFLKTFLEKGIWSVRFFPLSLSLVSVRTRLNQSSRLMMLEETTK